MRRAAVGVAAAALLLLPSVAHASTARDVALVRRGLTHARRAHWLKPADVAQFGATLSRAQRDLRRLPPLRAEILAAQVSQLTPLWDSYTRPRALALFGQLAANVQYLETHRVPYERVDVQDADGIVYRWFPGRGLEFHPLAAFSALNNVAASGDAQATQTMADALVARAIPRGNRDIWEYSFDYGIGRPPWASGFAEAVAAQALARAASLLGDPVLGEAAKRAFDAVPPLTMRTSAGPWIRLYGFDDETVLNAQLQTIVSLLDYEDLTNDPAAGVLAQQLEASAEALFPRFDTGDWSLYELGGGYASRGYEDFVTQLLARLAQKTGEQFWSEAAQRFYAYLHAAPQVVQTAPPQTVWPQPQDGYLDTGTLAFTLSQRASLTLSVAGKVTTYRLAAGPHTIVWKPPAGIAPGTYPVQVSTVSYAGNRGTFKLQPFVVQDDDQPPAITPTLAGDALTWSSTDAGTPWLDLTVELVDPAGVNPPQTLELGDQPLTGTLQLAPPPGTWQATLQATNSAGLATTVPLGTLTG